MATAIDRFLNYKIRDVELESRFRADRLQYDIGQARILTALVFLLFLVFIFLDPLLSVGENHVFNANIARLVAAFACMTAFFLIGKVTTPRKFDLAMLIVVLVIDANVVILAVVSPAEFRTLIAGIFWLFLLPTHSSRSPCHFKLRRHSFYRFQMPSSGSSLRIRIGRRSSSAQPFRCTWAPIFSGSIWPYDSNFTTEKVFYCY